MDREIIYYVTSGGQEIVKDFIDELQPNTQAKLARQLDLLEEFGSRPGTPHAKSMGGGLIKLRVRGRQEARIFYVFAIGQRIYLLHGFIKKTNTTPKKDLDIARKRQIEIKMRED